MKSIYFRLLAIYFFTFVAMGVGASWIFMRFQAPGKTDLVKANFNHYAELVSIEIGNPPDLKKAQQLHDDLGMDIAIISSSQKWGAPEEFLTKMQSLEKSAPEFDRPWPGPVASGHGVLRMQSGEVTYYFTGSRRTREFSILVAVVFMLMIGTILSVSFFVTKKLLKPIREMKEAAARFSQEDWSPRIHVKGRDDISELARTMNTMADAIEKQLQSMRELLIAVSHEFRSPLTRMKVALEFVSDEKARASINEEIHVLDKMTESLLERERLKSKPESLKKEDVHLQEFVQKIVDSYIRRGVQVKADLNAAGISVAIDKARIEVVLRSLIDNSLKHSQKNEVRIDLKKSTTSSYSCMIEISDDGSGFPGEVIKKFGEPFLVGDTSRTGPRTEGGFGMGLSLAVSIIQAHKGRIEIQNKSPHGARVFIQI